MKTDMSATNVSGRVLERLRKLYPTILLRCKTKWPNSNGEITLYDIVHETIVKLLSDTKAAEMADDDEFVRYFLYRANTTIYQATHDRKKRKKIYANYKTVETSKAAEEE